MVASVLARLSGRCVDVSLLCYVHPRTWSTQNNKVSHACLVSCFASCANWCSIVDCSTQGCGAVFVPYRDCRLCQLVVNCALVLRFRRAAEQLIGLPDATPDEEQQAAELDFAQQQQRRQQQQQQQEGGGGATDLWLKGRVAFATALMDVGEKLSVFDGRWSAHSCLFEDALVVCSTALPRC